MVNGDDFMPKECFFTKGVGRHAQKLMSFELALRDAGIQLRDTASFGLPGHVRLGVLPPASQAALRRAWAAARP